MTRSYSSQSSWVPPAARNTSRRSARRASASTPAIGSSGPITSADPSTVAHCHPARTTIVAKSGWEWVAVEGPAELCGPDDSKLGLDGEALRLLLRAVFVAAGGTHDNWDEYDRVMAAEHRTAVLVAPERVFGNG